MLFCVKCGKQINDDAIYCPYCGTKQLGYDDEPDQKPEEIFEQVSPDEIFENGYQEITKNPTIEVRDGGHVTPFGVSIKRIFTHIFRFHGRAERSEFNFQFLFSLMVSLLITIVSFFCSSIAKDILDYIEMFASVQTYADLELVYSIDIEEIIANAGQFDAINVGPVLSTFVFYLLMITPLYRRLYDAFQSTKFSLFAVIVVAFNVLVSTLLLFVPSGSMLYSFLDGLGILYFANIIFIFLAITTRTSLKNLGNNEE